MAAVLERSFMVDINNARRNKVYERVGGCG
jgi:hypothetical protein